MKVWLLIMLLAKGHPPITVEDSVQPDLKTCWERAAAAVEKATAVGGEFEFGASCSVVKAKSDPA